MSAGAVAIFRHGSARRRRDDEPWGQAFLFSILVHAGILAIFLLTGVHKGEETRAVLTEVNFVEKPVLPEAGPAAEPVKGATDLAAQAPVANPESQVVAFAAPATPSRSAEPVAAPIIQAPIAPIGQMGGVGLKKAALAPMPSARDVAPAKRGLMALPGAGGGDKARGSPIALATQGVDDVRRQGGGLGVPLTTQNGLMAGGSGGAVGAKPGAPIGENVTTLRKAPVETLMANPISKDTWGKKQGPFSLEGPLKYRKLKVMLMPPYPRWAEEKGIEASVSFRITADPKGHVKPDMYLEKTSGYSELDALAKEALLKFVFVPIPDGQPPEDEWGVATFKFELKK